MKNFLIIIGILLSVFPAKAQLNFSDRAGECGINHRYLSVLAGGGVSFYDFNQDGLDDIVFYEKKQNGIVSVLLNKGEWKTNIQRKNKRLYDTN